LKKTRAVEIQKAARDVSSVTAVSRLRQVINNNTCYYSIDEIKMNILGYYNLVDIK